MLFHRLLYLVQATCLNAAVLHQHQQTYQQEGQIVRFEINVTSQEVNPIGVGPRQAILVNGSFVGPTLKLNEGDEVEFLVHNYMREDTTIHFHGIGQRATPWSDGVPGLTQGQIYPGASFLYRWIAEDAGTYFYHAHSKGQLMDGLYGAIQIAAPEDAQRPFHLIDEDRKQQKAMRKAERDDQVLLVADWSQYPFAAFYSIEEKANIDLACTDAIMVNGLGSQYCLDQASLDNMTNPLVLQLLHELGYEHMTDKGCIPPLQLFQGDFDLDLDKLPSQAISECKVGKNSQGNFTFSVDSKLGWASLTFVNPGGLYPLQVAIDNHAMYVYALDGHYIHPKSVDRVLVNNGNRISVMVKLDQKPAKYTIRFANDLLNQILSGFAELVYDGATEPPHHPRPKMNHGGQPLSDNLRDFTPEDSHPYPALQPASSPDASFKVLLRKLGRPYGAYEWSLSGKIGYNMTEEETSPAVLFQRPSEMPNSELFVQTKLGQWVDMILVSEGPFAQSHPIHKHGNRVFVLGQAIGDFPWASVEEAERYLPESTFNFIDPPYLDTFNTVDIEGQGNSTWTVIRYKVENAGAWLMHCHVQTHLSGGMGMVILDGVDAFPEVPLEYREWNGFQPQSVHVA